MPVSFFDTNVIIYLIGDDAKKAERAEDLLRQGGVISVQVLNEITHVARRKMQLSWPELNDLLGSLRGILDVMPLTVETHETGIELAELYGLPTYDAMIAASALIARCGKLWSEDMSHGLRVGRDLLIANPFRDDLPS